MNTPQECKSLIRRNDGFALKHAIVVLVILLVIVAIVLPVYSKWKQGTDSKTCMKNMHSLGIALIMYTSEYDDALPSSAIVKHSKKWSRNDFIIFTTGADKQSPEVKPQTYYQALCDYVTDKDVAFCPSDPENRSAKGAKLSYWWKLAVDKAWYGKGCRISCDKTSAFSYPSDQVVIYERCPWHTGKHDGLQNGDSINAAYMDSHVQRVTLRNCMPGKTTTPAPESGEPAFFNGKYSSDGATLTDLPAGTPAKYIDPTICADKF